MLDESDKIMNAFAIATHVDKSKGVSAEILEKNWRINPELSKRTIRTTAQLNIQDVNYKLSRNLGTSNRMLRYRRIK